MGNSFQVMRTLQVTSFTHKTGSWTGTSWNPFQYNTLHFQMKPRLDVVTKKMTLV